MSCSIFWCSLAPVQDVSVFAVFALVQLGRVVIFDRARFDQCNLVPFVGRTSYEGAAAFLARKSPRLGLHVYYWLAFDKRFQISQNCRNNVGRN